MSKNFNFNDYPIPPTHVNMPHMPVIILCDVSGSMGGTPIQNVNLSVNRFAADVCKDPKAAGLVDVAVMSFNEAPHIEQEFRPITELQPVQFSAGGGTDISSALEMAVQKLRERGHLYEDNGIEVKMPYIILITDGYGGDVTEIAKTIGHFQRPKPSRAMAMPPKMPPKSRPMTPTVPCTKPTSDVVNPKPPFSIGSIRKNLQMGVKRASGKRYRSIKRRAAMMPGFLKNVTNVPHMAVKVSPNDWPAVCGVYAAGRGKARK